MSALDEFDSLTGNSFAPTVKEDPNHPFTDADKEKLRQLGATPPNATSQPTDALSEFDSLVSAKSPAAQPVANTPSLSIKDQPWSDVASSAVKNIPQSAGGFVQNIAHAIAHPIDTASSLLDVGAGELQKITPAPIENLINSLDWNKPAAERAKLAASGVNQFYADRYGSKAGIKNAISTDPVGVASDLSAVLTGGAGAAKLAGLGKTAEALSAASKVTNPLAPVQPVIRGVGSAAGAAGSELLGLSTGVGAENIRNAFISGMKGDTAFWDNLTGNASFDDVLDTAKQNLQNMSAAKSAEYRAGMADVSNDKSVLDFSGVDKAVSNANDAVTFNGQVKNARGAQIVQEMSDAVNHWKGLDPATFHTPEGFDALKQKIGGILEGIPYNEKTALMAGNKIYNGIKSEITAQAPVYADVMKNYSDASDQINEIQKALSLGNTASADTAIRKLQSLTRNNVNTNYGNRLDLAKQLEAQGGNEIIPGISGQAMNSLTSRGLSGKLGELATLGTAAAVSPSALLALPLQSPKLVGASLYGAGKAATAVKKLGINQQGLNYLNLIGRTANGENAPR